MSRATDSAVWRRAAVLGSLWASVEIVVGSFLHNLRVPFAGTLLSAFAVTVMVAAHRARPARGLFWRTALVCALIKSLSPSAVILGPMVGIFSEGVLLELAARLAGANALGYVLGGALAVSWSLVQRIASTLIAFGPNVVQVYVETWRYASRSLGVTRVGPFDLVLSLFLIECVLGMAAAAAGVRLARGLVARRAGLGDGAAARPAAGRQAAVSAAPPWPRPFDTAEGSRSIPRLIVFAAGVVAGMTVLGSLPLAAAAACVFAYAVLVVRLYPRALGRLRRPMFWIEAVGVMLLAGVVLGGIQGGAHGLVSGLGSGAQMVLRAILVLMGFTAVSVELRNPRILSWVERRRLRGLSDALGVAFGALPEFTARIADQRAFWRRPIIQGLGAMLDLATTLADSPDEHGSARPPALVIITGETGSGKTTLTTEVVERLRAEGLRVGGFLAPGLLSAGRRTGFDLLDLATGQQVTFCRESMGEKGGERWSRFHFSDEGLRLGRSALASAAASDVIVVDEVGPLELAGGGWSAALDGLAHDFSGPIVLVTRRALVSDVVKRWGGSAAVFEAGPDAAAAVVSAVREGRAR